MTIEKLLLPGPGAYEIRENKFSKNSLSFATSKREISFTQNTSPGPGDYNMQEMFGNGPKVLFNNN